MTKQEKILGWIFLVSSLLLIPILIVSANDYFHWQLSDGEQNFIMFCVNFALTALIFRKYLWQSLKPAVAHPWRTLRWAAVGLVIHFGGTVLLGFLFNRIAPDFANANDASLGQMAQQNYKLIAIGTVLLVPVTEEVLYRGLIFGSLYSKNRVLAYIVSALLFGMIHVVGYIGTLSPWHLLLSLLQYLPAGIALALACDKGDSIWAAILLHMAVNQIGISFMR